MALTSPVRARPRLPRQDHPSLQLCTGLRSARWRRYAAPSHPDIPADIRELYNALVKGDRYALARSITLVESYRQDHRQKAHQLLSLILESQKRHLVELKSTFRIGLSGSPGVGKSTFIEAFGMFLLQKGHKVAVLAVDPSSTRTGGSILGDKTRMTELSRQDNAYVRPSPSRGTLAGGYDITLVETVGVGQSETMVAEMVDMFVLLVPPAGGDELQGLKKGIVELSDLVLVNKADGVLADAARAAAMEYMSALKFLQPSNAVWRPKVLRISSVEQSGMDKAWEAMSGYQNVMMVSYWFCNAGLLDEKRGDQRRLWMWRQITAELLDRLNRDPVVRDTAEQLERRVFDGEMTSGQAADCVVDEFLSKCQGTNG
ncbi:ArgK protein-domain-containing protein [Jimgerdemannia flammicorona]|uniref:ArgK protein-domain-containing protein n=1 Tax=Jimgerdemannia flammicorona TaxID=994334 RepID=A0A433QQU6_9FUNG|nr:ArgK protein-domain-containing protein [Jimgerdemannia flammicorona]